MNKQIKTGLQDSIPFGVGFIFLYISIGMLGATKLHSFPQTISTTLFIFSSPLQFLLMQSSANYFIMIPIILSLNCRFLLMSSTLVPFFRETKPVKVFLSLILVVPSITTGALLRYKTQSKDAFTYFVTLGASIYLISILCTGLGFILTDKFNSPLLYKMMDIILPLQFTALSAKHWPDFKFISAFWLGLLISPVLIYVFKQYNLLITPFIIGFIVTLFDTSSVETGKK